VFLKSVRILTTSAILITVGTLPALASDVDELEHAREAAHQQQFRKSFTTLKTLAGRGHAQAQCLLGVMYQQGKGVRPCQQTAMRYYRMSAQKGFADAQNRLGHMYLNGNGIAKDATMAEHWITQAADHGLAEAQLFLGKAYLRGDGLLGKDETKARRYLLLARDQGVDEARNSLNEIPGYDKLASTVRTDSSQAGANYGQGLSNLEQSWQGYGDLVKSMESAAQAGSSH
jgi:uncharacterized protein